MPLIPEDKLRNANGTMVTTSLFWEFSCDMDKAFFTMTHSDKNGLVAFKPLYVKLTVEDPTEYTFALEVFGSWDHWQKMLKNRKVRDFVDTCREERDIAIESNAVREIIEEAATGKAKFQAAKFLVQKGYLKDMPKSAKNQSRKALQEDDDISNDLKRLLGS